VRLGLVVKAEVAAGPFRFGLGEILDRWPPRWLNLARHSHRGQVTPDRGHSSVWVCCGLFLDDAPFQGPLLRRQSPADTAGVWPWQSPTTALRATAAAPDGATASAGIPCFSDSGGTIVKARQG